jgi:hypothetical protein
MAGRQDTSLGDRDTLAGAWCRADRKEEAMKHGL